MPDWRNQIKRSQTRLDHQDVCAFFGTATAGGKRVVAIAHVELIVAPVAKLWRRICRAAKWSVEITRELCAIAHYRDQIETVFIQLRADVRDPAVHHVTRADAVRACFSKGQRRFRERIESGRMIDATVVENSAMSVGSVRAKTGIDPETQVPSELTANLRDQIAFELMAEVV